MNRKTGTLLTSLALTISMLFTACSSNSSPAMASPSVAPASSTAEYFEAAYDEAAPAPEGDNGFQENVNTDAGSGAQISAPANRKTIWHSSLSLESKEFDKAITVIAQQVADVGGYIESQNISGRSIGYSGEFYPRSAVINARIPSEKLGEVTDKIGQTCNIVSQSQSSEDVTDRYFDTQARLDTLNVQEERLLEILKKAGTLKDIFELEQELANVRYEIESLTASLRHIDSQVAYSYLNLELTEVGELKQGTVSPVTFGEKMSAALNQTGDLFVQSFQGIALFCVGTLPILLFWVLVIGLFVFAGLRISKRVQIKKTASRANLWKKSDSPILKVGEEPTRESSEPDETK